MRFRATLRWLPTGTLLLCLHTWNPREECANGFTNWDHKRKSLPILKVLTSRFWSPDNAFPRVFADGKLKKGGGIRRPVRRCVMRPSGTRRHACTGRCSCLQHQMRCRVALYRVSLRVEHHDGLATWIRVAGKLSHRWPNVAARRNALFDMATNFRGRRCVDAIFVWSRSPTKNDSRGIHGRTRPYADQATCSFTGIKALFAQRFGLKRFALTEETNTIRNDIIQPRLRGQVLEPPKGLTFAVRAGGVALSELLWFGPQRERRWERWTTRCFF